MRCFTTTATEQMAESTVPRRLLGGREWQLVRLYPTHLQHAITGFGGAVTESVAITFAQMNAAAQDEFLQRCFGQEGNAYNLVRIALQSCDFAQAPYEYVSDPHDVEFARFSIAHERDLLIPLLRCIKLVNPNVSFIASPWSPPAFMKTNRMRQYGGSLRKKHYENWAITIALALLAFADEGIDITRVTVQNEPHATQIWDSCRYTAGQELDFATRFLRPALDAAGLAHVRILGWDHNKERLLERADALLGDSAGARAFAGLAFHIYSGTHFESLREVRRCYPEAELLLSEGCMGFSDFNPDRATFHAERYAREWLGDIAAGANGCLDWNLLLDETGGPTYVGNFCDAPLMYDRRCEQLRDALDFTYLGHLSHFFRPGARVCTCSSYATDLETLAAVNPDGTRVVAVLNRTDDDLSFGLTDGAFLWDMESPAHSILTAVID